MIYVVTAYRNSDINPSFPHSYIVGVFDSKEKCLEIMDKEEKYRYGKYSCAFSVLGEINQSVHEEFYQSQNIFLPTQPEGTPEVPVCVCLNDETGSIFYSVTPKDDPEFWLDSFDSLKEAEEYILAKGYIYDKENDFIVKLSWENSKIYDTATRRTRTEGTDE